MTNSLIYSNHYGSTMKNSLAVFAIVAAAVISLGVSGVSANSLMTASVPEMLSTNMITGHLEYTLLDEAGNVKTYGQTDNFITTAGDRCIAELVFEPGSADTSNANCIDQPFGVIAVSNNTLTSEDNVDLVNDEQAAVNQVGIMATVNATSIDLSNPDVGTTSPSAITATISNSGHPFTFENDQTVTNVTTGSPEVEIAYLMQSICAGVPVDGTCDAVPGGEILASQTLSNLSISDGDSLTITWTVSVGADGS